MSNQEDKQTSSVKTIIESRPACFRFNLFELWQYRYLIGIFIYRDFVVLYKQTILGPIWWLFQPLLTTGVFTVVFSMIAKIPTDSLPPALFYFAGIVIWNYFATCFLHTAQSFQDNRELFQKIYFPRLVVPVAAVASNVLRFGLQLGLFVLFYAAYMIAGAPVRPDLSILLLPLLILYVGVLGFGSGILVASLTVKYRDLALILPFIAQLWMFASAVVVPVSSVPENWRFLFSLNPMIPPVELFRSMCFATPGVSCSVLLSGILSTLCITALGIVVFNRIERTFADTI